MTRRRARAPAPADVESTAREIGRRHVAVAKTPLKQTDAEDPRFASKTTAPDSRDASKTITELDSRATSKTVDELPPQGHADQRPMSPLSAWSERTSTRQSTSTTSRRPHSAADVAHGKPPVALEASWLNNDGKRHWSSIGRGEHPQPPPSQDNPSKLRSWESSLKQYGDNEQSKRDAQKLLEEEYEKRLQAEVATRERTRLLSAAAKINTPDPAMMVRPSKNKGLLNRVKREHLHRKLDREKARLWQDCLKQGFGSDASKHFREFNLKEAERRAELDSIGVSKLIRQAGFTDNKHRDSLRTFQHRLADDLNEVFEQDDDIERVDLDGEDEEEDIQGSGRYAANDRAGGTPFGSRPTSAVSDSLHSAQKGPSAHPTMLSVDGDASDDEQRSEKATAQVVKLRGGPTSVQNKLFKELSAARETQRKGKCTVEAESYKLNPQKHAPLQENRFEKLRQKHVAQVLGKVDELTLLRHRTMRPSSSAPQISAGKHAPREAVSQDTALQFQTTRHQHHQTSGSTQDNFAAGAWDPAAGIYRQSAKVAKTLEEVAKAGPIEMLQESLAKKKYAKYEELSKRPKDLFGEVETGEKKPFKVFASFGRERELDLQLERERRNPFVTVYYI